MERTTVLIRVINTRSIADRRVQQVRQLVVSDLRRVLAQDNPPANAYFMLGRLMALPGGDAHEAGRMLTGYLATEGLTNSQRAEALVIRARVQTNEKKSLADFDEAIRMMPENANYLLARALFHRAHKRLELALTDVATVLEQVPDETNGLILQGEILREQGKLDEAIASFNRASELTPQAPGPYQNRGEIYRLQNKYGKAVEQFSKVLEVQPGVLLTLVHRAEAYLRAGNSEQALIDVDRVLEKQPELVAAHRIRAEVYASMGRLSEAIAEMAQIAKAVPEQIGLKMQLALYYLVNKQPLEAIASYSGVLDVDPKNFLALRSRADTYLNMGKHVQAAADFRSALEINPKDTQLLNNYAWLLATSPLEEVREGKRAIELATKACTLTGFKQSHILSTLAASYAETGDFASAVKWSQEAVDMATQDRDATGSSSAQGQPGPDEGDQEIRAQLVEELTSYQHGKPWRELQSTEEDKAEPAVKSPASGSSATPNPKEVTAPVNSPDQSVDAN
jgi:tetratricopeptide (TPR) repeat protein